MFRTVLFAHIAAGSIGLLLGPVAMYSQKKEGIHTNVGAIYFYLMAFVCASAVVLSVMQWSRSWWLSLVAIFSFAGALKGYRAVRTRPQGWLKQHITGMLASYIAMTTALLITNYSNIPGYENIPYLLFWFLPTIIGTPLIRWMVGRHVPISG